MFSSIKVVCFLALIALVPGRLAAASDLPQTVVIFFDVSGSIKPKQFEKMKEHLREIVTTQSSRTRIEIYPLDASANAPAEALSIDGLAHSTNTEQRVAFGEFLKKLEGNRHPETIRERQSCILNSLHHARDRVENLTKSRRRVELVYISDMLEDCTTNDTRRRIHFHPQTTPEDTKQALAHVRRLPNRREWLKGARFTAILPPSVAPATTAPLSDFWREVMALHGAEVPPENSLVLYTSIPSHLQPTRSRRR
jgi:hypothetical protein